jgi:hypothetical protein
LYVGVGSRDMRGRRRRSREGRRRKRKMIE